MLKYYFEDEQENENMEKSKKLIFQQTDKKIEEVQKKLGQDLFETLSNDMEEWIFERYDNVRRCYFDGVVAFLLDKNYTSYKGKETLEQWLSSVGYDQQSFRKKIYQDNKEIINEALANDAIYERMKSMFKSGYFRSWDFSDISKGYPQSDLVRTFLHNLLEKNGFNKVLEDMVDFKTKQKINELNRLKGQLADINKQINEIE
ncbi:MAG: hypothetical protein WC123_08190 [Bacilli bacterium]